MTEINNVDPTPQPQPNPNPEPTPNGDGDVLDKLNEIRENYETKLVSNFSTENIQLKHWWIIIRKNIVKNIKMHWKILIWR